LREIVPSISILNKWLREVPRMEMIKDGNFENQEEQKE
jgi:hypothetical protein